jgi:radical SAM superfamily enzyme YgiQ (UPF0313 family)
LTSPNIKPAVILVADRTLSANYKILFEGIFATMQTTKVPEFAMRSFVSPKMPVDNNGRAKAVPLGLRRVQSALLTYTNLTEYDIVCTTPEALGSLLGPWVKVLGVSSSDPLGMGMSNTTTTSFWDGELYTRRWTRQLLKQISQAKQKYDFKVVGGGAGAWQWERYDDEVANDCIDVIFEGYFEQKGPKLFEDLIEGNPTESYICEDTTAADKIQPIRDPSLLGIIELSRGCGRGCSFCTMSDKKMTHTDPDTIIADLQTNVKSGIRSVVSGSEDFFRYGATGLKPDFDKLHDLLTRMRQVKDLSFMQIDHGNVTSVLQLTDEQLKETRRLLTWEVDTDYLWVNMGIENANGHLVAKQCPGKIAPFDPENWEDMIKQAAHKMADAGFYSVFSLVLGMPGETGDDVQRTIKLVDYLKDKPAVIFPIFYEPLRQTDIDAGNKFTLRKLRADHLELYSKCYEINFKKIPALYWDNQRAGGVPWAIRALTQMLGKTETAAWRKKFKKIGAQIAASS